jgi:polysaccharide export outer membrane protein
MIHGLIRAACWSFLLTFSVVATTAGSSTAAFAQSQPLAKSRASPNSQALANSQASAQSQQPATTSPAGEADYVLGPNDRVRLKVYGETDITGEYEVDSNGNVSIPLAGHIRAAGLTTRQLERAITSALSKGIVRDPRVNVEVASYRNFYILGEVKKGGEYPYRLGLTVMDAVATAGGFTYRANENKAYLRRSGSSVEEAYSLDASVPIFPGDNIRIPERYF